MRTSSELIKQAYTWAALVERGFVEGQNGLWRSPPQVNAYIQAHDLEGALSTQARHLLCTPPGRLTQSEVHDATWFCEPLAVLLWALGRFEFPDQDSDIPPMRAIRCVLEPDVPLEQARLRPLAEVEAARHTLYWRHRRLHAYLRGFTQLDTRAWWDDSPDAPQASPEGLLWEDGDLQFGGVPMSEFPPNLMPYGAEFIRVTGSRLRAIQWILGGQTFEDILASPYALTETDPHAALYHPDDSNKARVDAFNQWSPRGGIAFYDAISRDDPQAFDALLAQGFDPDQPDLDGDACLHHVFPHDARAVLRRLEGAALDWDRVGARGHTALELAIRLDELDHVRWLLEQGAHPDALGPKLTYPLQEAVHLGQMRHVGVLIDAGASPDGPPGSVPPLFCAISVDHPSMILALLKRGADLSKPHLSGTPALLWALQEGRSACAQLLIDEGADVFAQDAKQQSALHWAACKGDVAHVRAFIEAGLEIDGVTESGTTPLLLALVNDHPEAAAALLDAGADATVTLPSGRSALHFAIQHKRLPLVEALIAAGCDPNAMAEHQETPLHEAAASGVVQAIDLLVAAGADPTAALSNGMSPLHFAARLNRVAVARALCARTTCDLDAQEHERRWTPLHIALLHASLELIDVLLEAGASPDVPDDQGATALHLAAARRDGPVVKRLLEAGASLHAQDARGLVPRQWVDQNPNPQSALGAFPEG